MKIAVGGLSGSGKNTLGAELAKSLGITLLSPTFKDLAMKEGISLMEFQKKAEADPEIDRKFDDFVAEEAAKGDCVITTWLAAWLVAVDFRVYVFAPLEVRAARIARRDNLEYREALRHIKERDRNNRKRYKKLYNIDILDSSNFDISINAASFTPQQMRDITLKALEIKSIKR